MIQKIVLVFTCLCIVALPLQSQQTATDSEAGKADAKIQAYLDVSSGIWAVFGGALHLLGVLIAATVKGSNFPQSVLLGKSPEYVKAFTEEYKRQVLYRQSKSAFLGCGISTIAMFIFYMAYQDQ